MSKALIVVDMQNDFCDPSGSLYVNGVELILPGITDIMLNSDYSKIVLTKDWHPKVTSHWDDWTEHCVAGTWGAELSYWIDSCNNSIGDDFITVLKGTEPNEDGYSGFSVLKAGEKKSTGLKELLQSEHIDEIDICGVAGDVCVSATAIDGIVDFKTNVLLPLTVSIDFDRLSRCLVAWNDLGINIIGANTT